MPPATPAQAPPGAETAVTMLEALGTELDAAGLRTQLVIRAGAVPVLHVTSPAPGSLSEEIGAAPLAGTWHYFWPWSEPIHTTPADAATAIRRALTTPAAPAT
jgi:hypothetical protein